MSAVIKTVSIEIESALTILDLIATHRTLWLLILRPTVGVIRQYHQQEIIATLTNMVSETAPSVLPNLEKIRLVSSEAPYGPMCLFSRLRKLQIDVENVQLQDNYTWPLLENLHLRGAVDMTPLEEFMRRHEHLKHFHLAVVFTLRPFHPASTHIYEVLRPRLGTLLSLDLVKSTMDYAIEHAPDHGRSTLQHLYAQIDKITDEETAKNVRRAVVNVFNALMERELERHYTDIRRISIQRNIANLLSLSCSIEFFWKDELAIMGTTLADRSKDRLWINDEVNKASSISFFFERYTL